MRLLLLLGALLALGLGTTWVFRRPLFAGNVAVVDPGRLYRSAQPAPADWPALLDRLQPASILNLRGGWMGDPWYAAEFELGDDGKDVYDFPMSATKRPSRSELLTLLDLFDRCRYPLLVHCKSGADRTGLACGLYLMAKRGLPPEQAEAALSCEFGHIPLFGPEKMHEPFDEYAAWLAANGRTHTPEQLRDWVAREYRDDARRVTFQVLRPGPRPASPRPLAAD